MSQVVVTPTTEILIFTMHDNEHLVQEALRAGARGYLLKSDAKHYLVEAIRSLAIHKPFFTSKVSQALLGSFVAGPKPKKSALSNRERGVVQLIAAEVAGSSPVARAIISMA